MMAEKHQAELAAATVSLTNITKNITNITKNNEIVDTGESVSTMEPDVTQLIRLLTEQQHTITVLTAQLDNYMNGNTGEYPCEIGEEMPRRPYTINGVEVWISGRTEQEIAEKYAQLRMNGMGKDTNTQGKNKFSEYIVTCWGYITRRSKETTARNERCNINKHILPFFGEMYVEDIQWRDIQRFYDECNHLARSTVNKFKNILCKVLDCAVKDGIVTSNVARDRTLTISGGTTKRESVPPAEYERIKAQIANLEDGNAKNYIALAVYTGMRRGECLAMKWENIDFKHGLIHVTNAVAFSGNKTVVGEPKSKAGKRYIPLDENLRSILEPVRQQSGLLVCRKDGTPLTQSAYKRMYDKLKRQIDLAGYTPHQLRHTYATYLVAGGTDPKTVQSIMGHADIGTTMDTYVHADMDNILNAGKIYAEVSRGKMQFLQEKLQNKSA